MSKEELGETLNEPKMASGASSMANFILGLSVKYGLPSILCIYLLYSINQKDKQIYAQGERVTTALIESNHTVGELGDQIKELSEAIRQIKP